MADVKISQLPAATTPLAGTEVLPIVQGGVTVKASVANVLASTQSAGTANGVVYLNGSKVQTTGSALTFDGTNFGIGASSPSAKLDVKIAQLGGTAGNSVLATRLNGDAIGNADWLDAVQIRTSTGAGWSNAEWRIRRNVDSSAAQGAIGFGGDNTVLMYTNGSERARIDSSGNLLVGTTVATVNSGVGLKLQTSATQPSYSVVGSGSTDTGSSGFVMYSTGAGAYRFYVGYGGTVFATNTTISAISDQRLKENVQDLDVGLSAVMALKPRKFDWKSGKGKDTKGDRGFIAQEFEQVFPDLIDEWKDPAPEGEDPYKSVRADLIPVLVKAIQEQQAIITALTARVAALESN
jgi:hypothetical protein